MSNPVVISLNKSDKHTLTKYSQETIELEEGLGIIGDVHSDTTKKRQSRDTTGSTPANLRQVHLIHSELFNELQESGFTVKAGEMGENITTRGIDLLHLPMDTILRIGTSEIKITGLRTPCNQLNSIQAGLMKAVLDRDIEGNIIPKVGIMAVVTKSGKIKVDDEIKIILPLAPHRLLVKL